MLNNGNVTGVNRNFNIQRLNISDENRAELRNLLQGRSLSGNHSTVSNGDTVNISTEAMAMLNAHQDNTQLSTANARRAAAGQPLRESPPGHQQRPESEFRIFAESVLAPHMDNADEVFSRMESLILQPMRTLNLELSLEERTILREAILEEARRIAQDYLSGEDAERFVEGFQNIVREAELEERGYIRVLDRTSNSPTHRNPLSEADVHTRNSFLRDVMTDAQREQLNQAQAERDRQWYALPPALRGEDASGRITMSINEMLAAREQNPQYWQAFSEAVRAQRALSDEFAEYHNFQEQWQSWQAGEYTSDNWFVNASAEFEENSANVAAEIEQVLENFRFQFNIAGNNAFRGLFEQLPPNSDNPFLNWLLQLQAFKNNVYYYRDQYHS